MGVRARPRRENIAAASSYLLLENDDASNDDEEESHNFYEGAIIPAATNASSYAAAGYQRYKGITNPLSKEADMFFSQIDSSGRKTCDV